MTSASWGWATTAICSPKDPTFWAVMQITFIYTIGVVAIQFVAGLGMALLLDRAMRGIALLRTLIIIPILISPVVVGLTWRYMYEPWGVINYVLGKFGIAPIEWVSSQLRADLDHGRRYLAVDAVRGARAPGRAAVDSA